MQKLQNKCARLICLKPKFEHVTPLLNQLHWLPVSERITYKTLLYVYTCKSMNGLSPQYIQDCLVVKTPSRDMMRTHSTGSINFVVPVTKKCAGDRAFSVAAPYLWNRLPVHIRNAISLNSFKISHNPFASGIKKVLLYPITGLFSVKIRKKFLAIKNLSVNDTMSGQPNKRLIH